MILSTFDFHLKYFSFENLTRPGLGAEYEWKVITKQSDIIDKTYWLFTERGDITR